MIFASQDPDSKGLVMFLSAVIAVSNIVLLVWSFMQYVAAYKSESDAEKVRKLEEQLTTSRGIISVKRETLLNIVSDKAKWVQSRLSNENTRQVRTRSRTIDSSDPMNQLRENPLDVNSTGIQLTARKGRDHQIADGEVVRVGDTCNMSGGMQTPPVAPKRKKNSKVVGSTLLGDVKTVTNDEAAQRSGRLGNDTSEKLRKQRVKLLNAKRMA